MLRIVDTLFRIAVRGEVCTIKRTDAALAQAALDVQRAHAGAHASMLSRAMIRLRAAPGGPQAGGQAGGAAMRTIFRMDAERAPGRRSRPARRTSSATPPRGRPSSDLARDGALRGAVVLSIARGAGRCAAAR